MKETAQYRESLNRAAYGIYWVAFDGRLLYANPALAKMLGYGSAEELLSLGTSQAFYRDSGVRNNLRAEHLRATRPQAIAKWRRKDGSAFTVRIHGRRVRDPERGDECVEVLVEDVTERVELEKQLVQSQKCEAIGQLAGGIAHDFSNMIGAIIGRAELGIEETARGSRARCHFERVRQQAERAATLSRRLLAFARRQIPEPRSVDLNQLALETLSLLEKVIGTHIQICANLSPELAIVQADPIQVEQVLMNLCINACDAMPTGCALIVETANATLDEAFCALEPLAHLGDYVVLSVSDTGIGMDAARLDRIFEPFFTAKEPGKGTGLGLATVSGIVREHGGFVQVSSESGMGSTFRAYFPVGGDSPAAPARSIEASPQKSNL